MDENEQVWFAGVDVCAVLDYSNSYQTIMKLDEDERKLDYITDSQGKQKETLTINEFGLYSLILTSTKPEAKAFKRWITHDVLPSIRKAGLYTSDEVKSKEIELQRLANSIDEVETAIMNTKSTLKTLTTKKDNLVAELGIVIKSNPSQLQLNLEA